MKGSTSKKLQTVLITLFAVIPFFALIFAGTACAGVAGPKILTAEGGVTDSHGDTGHIVMGGLVFLNNNGTARALNLTIAYQDNPAIASSGADDSFFCVVTNPSDLTYSISNTVGTATLTLSSTDRCVSTLSGVIGLQAGHSISFQIYTLGAKVHMVSTGSTLLDAIGDELDNVAVSGEMDPSSAGSPQATGFRFISGGGGAVDPDDTYSGHMAMAGLIALAPLTKKVTTGTAKFLDLSLSFEDTNATNASWSCHFTNPNDVSYTLDRGVGLLTLTVSSQDTCSGSNTGHSIRFILYSGGASGRLVSVSSSSPLVDSTGDPIVPAVVAMFSTAGGL